MTLRQYLKQPGNQLRVGLAFLILASLSRWLLKPANGQLAEWTDGLTGLLYGISIGCMLVGIWRDKRRRKE